MVVDGRNALDPEAIVAAGFEYVGFGRDGRRYIAATTDESPEAARSGDAVGAVRPRARRRAPADKTRAGQRLDLSSLGIETNPTGA